MENRSVNPFFLCSEMLNFLVREEYLRFELSQDKQMMYFLTEKGERELPEKFGVCFDKPCAFKGE